MTRDTKPRAFVPMRAFLVLCTAVLAACGGGGGGDAASSGVASPVGPPTTQASVGASATDAQEASRTVAAAADDAVTRTAALGGFFGFVGAPIGLQGTPLGATLNGAARAGSEDVKRALRVEVAPCDDFFDPGCSGTATIDTNIAETAQRIAAGDYADIRFNSLTGRLYGYSASLSGRMRIDFDAALDPNAPSLAGLNVRVLLEALRGQLGGQPFGPISDAVRIQIGANNERTITMSARSYSGLSGLTVSGSGAYSIESVTIRLAHWTSTTGYVDLALTNWRVNGGRPQVGSQASLFGAGGSSASLLVQSVSATQVVYAVTLRSGTAQASYTVTATYPAGGGAPTYVAVPAG